jgi:molybdate transport system ATP-binding protein
LEHEAGTVVRARIPAREVILATEKPTQISAHNVIAGTVHGITAEPTRHETLVEVALDGVSLLARVTPDATESLGLVAGREVVAVVKSTSIEILPV